MKIKTMLFVLFCQLCLIFTCKAQMHNNVIDYNFNGTPFNGVKIKTNLPFTDGSQMPTIHIYGYNYGTGDVVDLSIVYYIFGGAFINYSASSAGNYAPPLSLSDENGKVVLFINDKQYFQRFTVSVYSIGRDVDEDSNSFKTWTVADEALTGSNTVQIPYRNSFSGDTKFAGGIWNSNGNVGIGTTTPSQKLSVNGTINAKEVVVTTSGWPDYVFNKGYHLSSLDSLNGFIENNGHLPGMPSAKDIRDNGQNVGEMNKKLLQKVEELTLYLLKQNKTIEAQKQELEALKKEVYLQKK